MPKHCQGAVRAPVGLAKFIKHKKLAELFPNKPSEAFHYRISDAGNPKASRSPKGNSKLPSKAGEASTEKAIPVCTWD